MKRLIVIILAITIIAVFTACAGAAETGSKAEAKISEEAEEKVSPTPGAASTSVPETSPTPEPELLKLEEEQAIFLPSAGTEFIFRGDELTSVLAENREWTLNRIENENGDAVDPGYTEYYAFNEDGSLRNKCNMWGDVSIYEGIWSASDAGIDLSYIDGSKLSFNVIVSNSDGTDCLYIYQDPEIGAMVYVPASPEEQGTVDTDDVWLAQNKETLCAAKVWKTVGMYTSDEVFKDCDKPNTITFYEDGTFYYIENGIDLKGEYKVDSCAIELKFSDDMIYNSRYSIQEENGIDCLYILYPFLDGGCYIYEPET